MTAAYRQLTPKKRKEVGESSSAIIFLGAERGWECHADLAPSGKKETSGIGKKCSCNNFLLNP